MQDTPHNYTFWQLLQDHRIIIPIIQRDYAQGRESEDVIQIRQELLKNLNNAISKGPSIDFDFIYGSIEGKSYIPLDGQQRLTTLFLLHWYLAAKDGVLNDNIKDILKKFSYDTRSSSADFCKSLVENGIDQAKLNPTSVDTFKISDELKNAAWFFISWKKDPTIQAMLVMIDAIQEHFSQSGATFDHLIDSGNPPVTFQSLRLEHFGLSDTLYIKMNARGKPLTEFENFKARFEQLLEETAPEFKDDFSHKMDGIWTDLFWHYRDIGTFLFDKEFMNFFKAIATNRYAVNNEDRFVNRNAMQDLINENKTISFTNYKEWKCFDKKGIVDVIATLDLLSGEKTGIQTYLSDDTLVDEKALFKIVIGNRNDYTYARRIQFYALTQYIIEHGNDGIDIWMRIVRNLTENYFYDNADEFMRDIKSIHQLIPFGKNILNHIGDVTTSFLGFTIAQKEEERIKALLIQKSNQWQEEIASIENHPYFNGQIGFLLEFSGIRSYYIAKSNLNWSQEEDATFFLSFYTYAHKIPKVFAPLGLKDFKDFVWERALLTKGDYLMNDGLNHSFVLNNDRDISWKRFLRGGKPNENDRRDYIKYLLDDIDSSVDIEVELHRIINEFMSAGTPDNWRKHFIRDSNVIRVCNKRYIRWRDENNILLLDKTQTNGRHYELYTYSLYLLLRKQNQTVYYSDVNTIEENAAINSINSKPVRIIFSESNNQFRVFFNGESDYFKTENLVIEYLKEKGILVSQTPIVIPITSISPIKS